MKNNNDYEFYAPLRNDIVFKGFFSKASNKKFLVALINNYLDLNLTEDMDIEFGNVELLPNSKDDKLPRLDILLKVKQDDEIVLNLEIQVQHQYNLIKRINYYNSKLYVEQLESGMDYKSLPSVISLVFVYHDVFRDDFYSQSYVNNIYLWHQESAKVLEDNNHMCFVELRKYDKNRQKKIEGEGDIMAEAVKQLKSFSQKYKDRYWEDMRLKREFDDISNRNALISIGMEQGIEQGIVEGISQGRIETALNMLKMNIDIGIISQATELSIDEILELEKNK